VNYVGAVSDQTVALGPDIAAATATQVAGGSYPRIRFQGALPPTYDKGVAIEVGTSGEGNTLSLLTTGAYLAASGQSQAYDLTMPDVASLAGFPAAARLSSGNRFMLTTAVGFTGMGAFDHAPALGSQFCAAAKGSSIQIP
jgi:hypothetical protein